MMETQRSVEARLPETVVVIIALGVAILWVAILVGVLAYLSVGRGTPDELFGLLPVGATGAMRIGLLVQYVIVFSSILIIVIMGTWVVAAHYSRDPEQGCIAATWTLRVLMVLLFLRMLSGIAMPLALGSFAAALPTLATALPVVLIEIAFLVCADIYISRLRGRP